MGSKSGLDTQKFFLRFVARRAASDQATIDKARNALLSKVLSGLPQGVPANSYEGLLHSISCLFLSIRQTCFHTIRARKCPTQGHLFIGTSVRKHCYVDVSEALRRVTVGVYPKPSLSDIIRITLREQCLQGVTDRSKCPRFLCDGIAQRTAVVADRPPPTLFVGCGSFGTVLNFLEPETFFNFEYKTPNDSEERVHYRMFGRICETNGRFGLRWSKGGKMYDFQPDREDTFIEAEGNNMLEGDDDRAVFVIFRAI